MKNLKKHLANKKRNNLKKKRKKKENRKHYCVLSLYMFGIGVIRGGRTETIEFTEMSI